MAEFDPTLIAASEGPADRVVRVRRRFALDPGHGSVRSAQLRATALGVFEIDLNGSPAHPSVLSPGWSSYEWRVRYVEHDVADKLEPINDRKVVPPPGASPLAT